MISTTAEYALRAVVSLANRPEQLVNRQELSRHTGVPVDYLTKVLGKLDAVGIVESQRGPGGGYRLIHSPDETTALEVVSAVDKIQRITSCPLGIGKHRELCPLHRLLDDAGRKIEEAFAEVTIQDLLKQKRNSRSCVFPHLPGTA